MTRIAALGLALLFVAACSSNGSGQPPPTPSSASMPATSQSTAAPGFDANFTDHRVLEESSMSGSTDPDLWLNSGGRLTLGGGLAQTIHGSLPPTDPWRQEYVKEGGESAMGTDGGRHPQNLFRLLYTHPTLNTQQEFYFRIDAVNLSHDPQRAEWSGVFSMSRYGADGDNLYYAGLRHDGTAVIKKKQVDIRTSDHYADALAQPKVFSGAYDRNAKPNLIPEGAWIGLRSAVTTDSRGSVTIRLWTDVGRTGTWRLVATATDEDAGGVKPISQAGLSGIRTDFMDVSFRDYRISDLPPAS
jgi:hypothetical protein